MDSSVDKELAGWMPPGVVFSVQVEAMTSDVCQGSLLGLVLFSVLINGTDSGIEGIPSRFGDDTKLSSTADTTQGWDAIQMDPVKLEN